MGAMLGVRLDDDVERRLAAQARIEGRSRSDIARAALEQYLGQRDVTEALRRDAMAIAAWEVRHPEGDDDDFFMALSDEVWRAIDE